MFGKFALPIVATGLAALAMSAAPLMAQQPETAARVTIDYRGVDLSSVQGRQTLDRRVDAAITKICGQPVYGTRDEDEVLGQCRREMRSRIEPMVASVLLTANSRAAPQR